MSKIKYFNYDTFKLPLLALLVLSALVITSLFSISANAQNVYRNLILSSQYNEHYLSPYLTRYIQNEPISDVRDIALNPLLQKENLNSTGSLVILELNQDTTWLTFDVTNRSTQENWLIDFGSSFDGRFGFFNNVSAYTLNRETMVVEEFKIQKDQNIKISLTPNQKSQVIIKLAKTEFLPITTPLRLVNISENGNENISHAFLISTMLLVGMAFFFAAVSVVKFKHSYLFFSLYHNKDLFIFQ